MLSTLSRFGTASKHKSEIFSVLERFLLHKELSLVAMMKNPPSFRPGPHRPFAVILLATVALGGWLAAPEVHSQAPQAATTSNAALNTLLVKLKSQQDAMAANQTKIEAQTALLKENIRQAKIYAARGGSGHR